MPPVLRAIPADGPSTKSVEVAGGRSGGRKMAFRSREPWGGQKRTDSIGNSVKMSHSGPLDPGFGGSGFLRWGLEKPPQAALIGGSFTTLRTRAFHQRSKVREMGVSPGLEPGFTSPVQGVRRTDLPQPMCWTETDGPLNTDAHRHSTLTARDPDGVACSGSSRLGSNHQRPGTSGPSR